jgi:hypothetical protein
MELLRWQRGDVALERVSISTYLNSRTVKKLKRSTWAILVRDSFSSRRGLDGRAVRLEGIERNRSRGSPFTGVKQSCQQICRKAGFDPHRTLTD